MTHRILMTREGVHVLTELLVEVGSLSVVQVTRWSGYMGRVSHHGLSKWIKWGRTDL